jgi:hypothetical protein
VAPIGSRGPSDRHRDDLYPVHRIPATPDGMQRAHMRSGRSHVASGAEAGLPRPSDLTASPMSIPLVGSAVVRRARSCEGSQWLKWTTADPQPTPCTQTFWKPGTSGARSSVDTNMLAVNDSLFPSPAR